MESGRSGYRLRSRLSFSLRGGGLCLLHLQHVCYMTEVPAALGAKMLLAYQWSGSGVFNMEQFNPDPFMAEIGDLGLPWVETFQPDKFTEPAA
jgi:saccharopine dehydrogenase-like NADP-dependent oxidoreductase